VVVFGVLLPRPRPGGLQASVTFVREKGQYLHYINALYHVGRERKHKTILAATSETLTSLLTYIYAHSTSAATTDDDTDYFITATTTLEYNRQHVDTIHTFQTK
jgi:hypothetical protein